MDKLCSHWVGRTNLNTCNCSRKVTSDYLDKALTSWPASSPASERGPDVMRPWDDLADWYWQYWNEIETGLTLLRSSDQIPSNPLRDELVGLYFRHVHPLCPIFEEDEFYEKYYLEGDDLAFLQCVSLLEFQSMMFAASLHLNSHQICQTQYTSTFQCHEELFKIAKNTYHASHDASPIALTRAALLLSYWSPYDSEKQSNSYWVDQAFEKAKVARLFEPHHNLRAISSGRRKLLWWCCLLRNRLLAFGLHRCGSLHEDTSPGTLPSQEDFGLEATSPQFMDKASKQQSINNFILQCELSQMISWILQFQGRRDSGKESERLRGVVDASELLEVSSLLSALTEWGKKVEYPIEDTAERFPPGICNMPCQLTRIFYNSAIVSLCLSYTHLDPLDFSPIAADFAETALGEVKGAVSRIAKITEILAYKVDSNDIPLSIGAWITIPIGVKLVFIHNSADVANPASDIREMHSLFNVLYILKHRFTGGKFLCNMLDAVVSHIFLAGGKNSRQEVTGLLQDAIAIIAKGLAHGIVPNAKL